jgi:hypothetical protein
MIVSNVPIGARAVIMRNGRQYSYTQPFSGSEWDPAQPMGLFAGDEIDFLWNVSSSTTPLPIVTAFFRYDASLPQNKSG